MPQSLDNRTQRDLNPLCKHLLPPPVSTTAHHKLPSGSLSTDSHRQLSTGSSRCHRLPSAVRRLPSLQLKLPASSPTFHAYSRTRTSTEPWDVSKHQQGTGAPSARPPLASPSCLARSPAKVEARRATAGLPCGSAATARLAEATRRRIHRYPSSLLDSQAPCLFGCCGPPTDCRAIHPLSRPPSGRLVFLLGSGGRPASS